MRPVSLPPFDLHRTSVPYPAQALSQGIKVVDAAPAPAQPHSSTSSTSPPDTAEDRGSGGGTDTWQPAGFGPLYDEDEDEYDGDDEDESWDDVVSELGNPWDMRPARGGWGAGRGGGRQVGHGRA